MQNVVKDYLRTGRRLIPDFHFMMRYPIEEKLPRVKVPTMLMRSEKDLIASQRWFDEAARLLDTNRTAVIPNWSHAIQYSAPKQLTEAIQAFLGEPL